MESIASGIIKYFQVLEFFNYFLDRPLLNHDILKKVNKNTILLSHHGTVLLEAAHHGFKSICSKASF